MSRTFRKVSHKMKPFYKKDIVRDGSFTCDDPRCERNGGCSYCKENRLYSTRKKVSLKEEIKLFELEE